MNKITIGLVVSCLIVVVIFGIGLAKQKQQVAGLTSQLVAAKQNSFKIQKSVVSLASAQQQLVSTVQSLDSSLVKWQKVAATKAEVARANKQVGNAYTALNNMAANLKMSDQELDAKVNMVKGEVAEVGRQTKTARLENQVTAKQVESSRQEANRALSQAQVNIKQTQTRVVEVQQATKQLDQQLAVVEAKTDLVSESQARELQRQSKSSIRTMIPFIGPTLEDARDHNISRQEYERFLQGCQKMQEKYQTK